jgi:uracil-DNA glycosylase
LPPEREDLQSLLAEIRACRLCAGRLPHEPRPVVKGEATARLLVIGQAPGTRVHATGIPFNDRSGERLREWMGVGPDLFYDESRVAIVPMGFCFPGQDARGADLPPLKICARTWHPRVEAALPEVRIRLLIGSYAQAHYLGPRCRENLTQTVRHWRDYAPHLFPLPHPSWRNNAWLKRNPWFEDEVLPALRAAIRDLFS